MVQFFLPHSVEQCKAAYNAQTKWTDLDCKSVSRLLLSVIEVQLVPLLYTLQSLHCVTCKLWCHSVTVMQCFLLTEYAATKSVCVAVHGQDLWTTDNRSLYFHATTHSKTHQTEPFLRYVTTSTSTTIIFMVNSNKINICKAHSVCS